MMRRFHKLGFLLLLGVILTRTKAQLLGYTRRVNYGYFPEARPIRVACTRGWFNYLDPSTNIQYEVTCYPQTSGTFAASRLDSDSLQLAELGSTPLAMALARGLDIKVVYIEHYKGESQGIYARPSGTNYTGIQNPFDLEGRRLGVPFGSTMHYQLLYMLDIFDLTGKVELLNLSPTEIMEEWDAENIDAAACWGVARQHILDQYVPANTLLTSGVLADWGRPTFNVVAVHTPFLNSNLKFVERFVRILSLLTDSFIDNLGVVDYGNVLRWAPKTFSYMTDVSDSLMKPGAMKGAPSIDFINTNRLIMDLFVQKSTEEQLSCDYLGGVNQCSEPSFIHIAIQQTAEFLMGQKLIQSMGPLEDLGDDTSCNQANTLCGGDTFAGWVLSSARSVFSSITLDSLDSGGTAEGYEIGRNGGDSTCRSSESSELTASGQRKSFGDGANVQDGKSYSDNLDCWWSIKSYADAFTPVELFFENARIWSGDYIRVYSAPYDDCNVSSDEKVLLAQITGLQLRSPNVRANGCILVNFKTDANQERSYHDLSAIGDGFLAYYQSSSNFCVKSSDCNGFPCSLEGLCQCDGLHWGADCSFTDYCIGTSYIELFFNAVEISSTDRLNPTYINDQDCAFVLHVNDGSSFVVFEVSYDIETTFDFLELYQGSFHSTATLHSILSAEYADGQFFIPTDSEGYATVRFVSDSQGTRTGFRGTVKTEIIPFSTSCPPGASGLFCEIPHCIARNNIRALLDSSPDTDGVYQIGRVVSQKKGQGVPPMPWSSDDLAGCVWSLSITPPPQNTVAIRLHFKSPLDLEPQPKSAIGDKLVIKAGGTSQELFVERCPSNELCNSPWQTGDCVEGGCAVKKAVDFSFDSVNEAEAIFITDRGDGGKIYNGFDFDALFVEKCPSEDGESHCEAGDGTCVDGVCYCDGGIPCACPCNTDFIANFNTGLFIGIIVSLVIIFVGIFVCYRRRKIKKSREQKGIIAQKEEQLEAFRNSVVGMRTAATHYMPTAVATPETAHTSGVVDVDLPHPNKYQRETTLPPTPAFQWCWKETSQMMSNHKPDMIVGDPADCWVKYDTTSNTLLENAYQAYSTKHKKKLRIAIPIPGYEVDFQVMEQTKKQTGFIRDVQRLVKVAQPAVPQVTSDRLSERKEVNRGEVEVGRVLPSELIEEPQMVLVKGDIVQISDQREDGWAFGTKLHHNDEATARELVRLASEEVADANIFTDTGWFPLDLTNMPSGEELSLLQAKVGDTGGLQAPSNWDDIVDPTVVQRHKLHKGDPEYDAVVRAFMSTLKPPGFKNKVKVIGVERIQNLGMWQSYVVKRQTICYRETGFQGADSSVDSAQARKRALDRFERDWLWHGTNIEVLEKILQQGFNRSFCGKNATMYGKGVYFARDASYSAYPIYSIPDSKNHQYMLACKVIVGEYCPGIRDALTPDIRDPSTQTLYDSTIGLLRDDTMADPSIYVTYHDAQAYPEYLIKFKLS